jgi:hypothetical protein
MVDIDLSMSGAILVGLELYETKANIQDTDDKMNKFKGKAIRSSSTLSSL